MNRKLPGVDRAGSTLSYVREMDIPRSADDVFAFCSDLRNELRWNPDAKSIELLTDPPIGVGTRFRARWTGAPSAVVEIVAWDPPRSWETRSRTMGMEARTVGLVEPTAGGSRYRITVELRPSRITRLLARLAIGMMERREDRNMARIRASLSNANP